MNPNGTLTNTPTDRLLAREPDQEYLTEWAEVISRVAVTQAAAEISVFVFRLHDERLALPTQALLGVVEPSPIHSIPGRSGGTLLGVANLNGRLEVCVSLLGVLKAHPREAVGAAQRMMVFGKESERYVTPVSDIIGVHRVSVLDLHPPPAGPGASHLRGLFYYQLEPVGLLEPDSLYAAINRAMLR